MKNFIFIIVIIFFIIGGFLFLNNKGPSIVETKIYDSAEFGLKFSYSSKYFIALEESFSGERNQHVVVLAEDTPETRSIFSGEIYGTETSPTITISIFQNNLDNYTTEGFIKNTNFSNFKLSDGKLTEVVVDGQKGLQYFSDGLYPNENIVVVSPNYVYMFTAFFNSPEDQILADYKEILKTVVFE